MKIEYIIVHGAATPPDMDIGVKEIDRWHRQRGWLGIGYHIVIRRNGVWERGRDIGNRGAHCLGFNHNSIGICMVGGADHKGSPENNYTEAQLETLSSLLSCLTLAFPHAEVRGHRDMPGADTACPSFDVQEWWYEGETETQEDES